MGNRYFHERIPPGLSFSNLWRRAGTGRWCKRQLSKARRAFGKRLCREGDRAWRNMRSVPHWERECNWKGW